MVQSCSPLCNRWSYTVGYAHAREQALAIRFCLKIKDMREGSHQNFIRIVGGLQNFVKNFSFSCNPPPTVFNDYSLTMVFFLQQMWLDQNITNNAYFKSKYILPYFRANYCQQNKFFKFPLQLYSNCVISYTYCLIFSHIIFMLALQLLLFLIIKYFMWELFGFELSVFESVSSVKIFQIFFRGHNTQTIAACMYSMYF